MSFSKKKVVIIGSGVAGMATAVRLAVLGFEVVVYEQNSYPGGKLSAFEKDGFQFDAGPSLFTQPQHIEELFAFAGEHVEKYFSYKKLPVACKYFYENGTVINAYTDVEKFAGELSDKAGEHPDNVKRYLKNSGNLYDNIGSVFLNHSLHKRKTWLHTRSLKALKSLKLSYVFSSLGRYNTKQFFKKETQQIFNRFATYNGSNPFKAPAMLSLIPHLEQNEGAFYPAGGMISITNALYKLALAKDVKFYFNAPVQKIIYSENVASGVVVYDENVTADAVVSNADIYFTYKNLLGNTRRAAKILKQERSSSALVFYWGVNKKMAQLDLHNILFTKDYPEEFQHIFKIKKLYHDPTVYINITSKMEPDNCPAGHESWFVMINVAANTNYDEADFTAIARKYIIEKINAVLKEDIAAHIVSEEILHPQLMQAKTGSYLGSLYGTSSNSKTAAFFRHANFTARVKNLYFCGGSVHPGGGIPLCMSSAKIVSDIILHDQKKRKH